MIGIHAYKEFLLVSAAVLILLLLRPLEIDDFRTRNWINALVLISLPFIAFRFWPKNLGVLKIIAVIFGTLVYVLVSIYFWFVCVFGFCIWSDYGTVYNHKTDKSQKIIVRGYSCYMTDDDLVLFKKLELVKHIYWVTEVDKAQLDTTQWQMRF